MKVLVATHLGQGEEEGDYCWTLDGELVSPIVVECGDPDACGCRRGFPGFGSARPTTTAMVADLPHMDEDDLVVAVTDFLTKEGWLEGLCPLHREEAIDDVVDAIIEVGETYPVGTIVRRRGDDVYAAGRRAA